MREGHEIASSLLLLAMTKGMRHSQPFFIVIVGLFTCHCEPKAWQSREGEILSVD